VPSGGKIILFMKERRGSYKNTGNGYCGENSRRDSIAEQSQQGYKKMVILLAIFFFIIAFRTTIVERIIVNGKSMYPTLSDSDICIAKKYDIEPKRYDIVIAKVDGQTLIKRVIGLSGETLQVIDGTVYIDGEIVNGKYDFFTADMGLLETPYTVGENEFFLMGDNRGGSFDSREFGSIRQEDIKGIVVCRIFPFWKVEMYSR
jgi:signal peptidase I